MTVIIQPKLQVGTQVPPFELMSADGHAVNIWNFKGLRNMVLIFLAGEKCDTCLDFLRSAASSINEYEEELAVVLPVIKGSVGQAVEIRDTLSPSFPILHDRTGKVTEEYTDILPAVFVADRFGELYAEWIVGPDHPFPSQREILDVIELINLECPECGARLDWT